MMCRALPCEDTGGWAVSLLITALCMVLGLSFHFSGGSDQETLRCGAEGYSRINASGHQNPGREASTTGEPKGIGLLAAVSPQYCAGGARNQGRSFPSVRK